MLVLGGGYGGRHGLYGGVGKRKAVRDNLCWIRDEKGIWAGNKEERKKYLNIYHLDFEWKFNFKLRNTIFLAGWFLFTCLSTNRIKLICFVVKLKDSSRVELQS